MGRYIIEFGMGTDFHGQDVSKAAAKAVKDAVSRSCLCGLSEVLRLEESGQDHGHCGGAEAGGGESQTGSGMPSYWKCGGSGSKWRIASAWTVPAPVWRQR